LQKSLSHTVGVCLLALLVTRRFTGDFLPVDLTLVYFITLFYLLIGKFLNKDKGQSNGVVLTILITFYFLFILSLLLSNLGTYSVDKFYIFSSLAVLPFFFGTVTRFKVESFIRIFTLFFAVSISYIVFSSLATGGVGLLLSVSGLGFTLTDSGNTNVVSAYLVMGITSIYFVLKNRTARASFIFYWYLIVLFLALLFLFLTGSKGAYFSLFAAFLWILLMQAKLKVSAFIIFLLFIAFIGTSTDGLSFLSEFAPESWHSFIENQLLGAANSDSVNSRLLLVGSALDGYLESSSMFNILFGHGLGGFAGLIGDFEVRTYPHNIFVEVLYEMGLFSLMVFVFIIFTVIKRGLKQGAYACDELVWLYVMLIFFLVRSMTTDDLSGNVFVFIFIHLISLSGRDMIFRKV
jgi:O-antigen ligase